MSSLEYVKFERITLRGHAEFNEFWVQDRIAEDPSILGLGKLILKDKEKIQPRAGRLDLLLQDLDSEHRYEVEVQLGATDESHIIRTIEYWDIERKRYPQYDHTAVIVAEDVTSRFLNVIALFNGVIPLIAIQMNALRCGEQISLVCTTVLNKMTLGLEEEDEEREVVDRSYWEKQATKETVQFVDQFMERIHNFAPAIELKYNKVYIGLKQDGRPNNFVTFQPQKNAIRVRLEMARSDAVEKQLEEKGLDVANYAAWGLYNIRLSKAEVADHAEFLGDLMKRSFEERSR